MRIGVLLGGRSGERDVSLRSGRAVLAALASRGHDAVEIDPGADLMSQIRDAKIECAFIALHGRYGEDGTVQGILEWMGIPYTGSGLLASAIAIDKVATKRLMRSEGLPTPLFDVVAAGAPPATKVPLPYVVKPAREGSSLGLTIVKDNADLPEALAAAHRLDSDALVEAYVRGPETTVAVVGGHAPKALPPIEIRPKSGLYDYASKYTKGATEYLIPPPSLSASEIARIQELALRAHKVLGCYGMSRVDFICGPEGPMILEVNTIPGMTETSLLPKAAAAAGISFAEMVEGQVTFAMERKPLR